MVTDTYDVCMFSILYNHKFLALNQYFKHGIVSQGYCAKQSTDYFGSSTAFEDQVISISR